MKSSHKVHCDKCRKEVPKIKGYLKKVNEGFLCKECIRENRKNHREFLRRDILGIRKRSDLLEEWAEKRELRAKIVGSKPQIKSIKKERIKISVSGLYLTKNEKYGLYKKLVQGENPLSSEEANKRINNLSEQVKILMERLRDEIEERNTKNPEEELNKRFKEGFAKLMEEME